MVNQLFLDVQSQPPLMQFSAIPMHLIIGYWRAEPGNILLPIIRKRAMRSLLLKGLSSDFFVFLWTHSTTLNSLYIMEPRNALNSQGEATPMLNTAGKSYLSTGCAVFNAPHNVVCLLGC